MPIDDPTREAYEAFATEIPNWEEQPQRRFVEWPATRSLLPDVAGDRVLDAGCGTGGYSEWLVEQGAEVVGVDASRTSIEQARERLAGEPAAFHCADLTEPLDFLDAGSVDVVLSQLVLEHVPDWRPVFAEWFRVLRPGGTLVFSTGHPVSNWVNLDGASDFHETERFTQEWNGRTLYSYRRPLAEHVNPLVDAGFRIERLVEPTPEEAFREYDPDRYEELSVLPRWECVRARKPE